MQKGFVGPNHTVSTLDFVHAGGAPWGGGVIFDLPATLPVAKAQAGGGRAPSGGSQALDA